MVEGVKRLRIQLSMSLLIGLLPMGIGTPLWAYSPQSASEAPAAPDTNQETPSNSQGQVEQLKALLLEQKKAIEELRAELLQQRSLIEKLENKKDGEETSLAGTPGDPVSLNSDGTDPPRRAREPWSRRVAPLPARLSWQSQTVKARKNRQLTRWL